MLETLCNKVAAFPINIAKFLKSVKPAGKDYVNVKPASPVCMCCGNVAINKKQDKFIYNYIFIYSKCNCIYNVNVNVM